MPLQEKVKSYAKRTVLPLLVGLLPALSWSLFGPLSVGLKIERTKQMRGCTGGESCPFHKLYELPICASSTAAYLVDCAQESVSLILVDLLLVYQDLNVSCTSFS